MDNPQLTAELLPDDSLSPATHTLSLANATKINENEQEEPTSPPSRPSFQRLSLFPRPSSRSSEDEDGEGESTALSTPKFGEPRDRAEAILTRLALQSGASKVMVSSSDSEEEQLPVVAAGGNGDLEKMRRGGSGWVPASAKKTEGTSSSHPKASSSEMVNSEVAGRSSIDFSSTVAQLRGGAPSSTKKSAPVAKICDDTKKNGKEGTPKKTTSSSAAEEGMNDAGSRAYISFHHFTDTPKVPSEDEEEPITSNGNPTCQQDVHHLRPDKPIDGPSVSKKQTTLSSPTVVTTPPSAPLCLLAPSSSASSSARASVSNLIRTSPSPLPVGPLNPAETGLEGWVKKFSPSFGRGWQDRYFRLLDADGLLVYWIEAPPTDGLVEAPRGKIELKNVTRCSPVDGLTLLMSLPGRDYILQFSQPSVKDVWMDILRVAIYNAIILAREGSLSGSDTDPQPAIAPVSCTKTEGGGVPKPSRHNSSTLAMTTLGRQRGVSTSRLASFLDEWFVRPLKQVNAASSELAALSTVDWDAKRQFLLVKGLLTPLLTAWKAQKASRKSIVDLRLYVPDVEEVGASKLTQYLEDTASSPAVDFVADVLNFCTDHMMPEGLPLRYHIAVARYHLSKATHRLAEEAALENVIFGHIRYGKLQDGLSEIDMNCYLGLMISSRPVTNGKANQMRSQNLQSVPLKIQETPILFDTLYLFDVAFNQSAPVDVLDVKKCWEIKRVRETAKHFEWTMKSPPHGALVRFTASTGRDAHQWRMAQVMSKLAHHSEKERSLFLRYQYAREEAENGRLRIQSAPISKNQDEDVGKVSMMAAVAAASTGEAFIDPLVTAVTSSTKKSSASSSLTRGEGSPSMAVHPLSLLSYPGTLVVRRRSTQYGRHKGEKTLERYHRRRRREKLARRHHRALRELPLKDRAISALHSSPFTFLYGGFPRVDEYENHLKKMGAPARASSVSGVLMGGPRRRDRHRRTPSKVQRKKKALPVV